MIVLISIFLINSILAALIVLMMYSLGKLELPEPSKDHDPESVHIFYHSQKNKSDLEIVNHAPPHNRSVKKVIIRSSVRSAKNKTTRPHDKAAKREIDAPSQHGNRNGLRDLPDFQKWAQSQFPNEVKE